MKIHECIKNVYKVGYMKTNTKFNWCNNLNKHAVTYKLINEYKHNWKIKETHFIINKMQYSDKHVNMDVNESL